MAKHVYTSSNAALKLNKHYALWLVMLKKNRAFYLVSLRYSRASILLDSLNS